MSRLNSKKNVFLMILLLICVTLTNASTGFQTPCFQENVLDVGSMCTSQTGPWRETNCSNMNGALYCSKSCRSQQVTGTDYKKVVCQHSSPDSNHCNKCKGNGGSEKCTGTPSYCDKFGCRISHHCYCEYTEYNLKFECDLNGVWTNAIIEPVQFSVKEPTFHRPIGSLNPWKVPYTRRGRNLITIAFDSPTVIIGTQSPQWTKVLLAKDGLSEVATCNSTRCEISLSYRYFLNPGAVKVVVFINDTLDSQKSFNVGIQHRCDVPNCVFCTAMIYDFHCYPWQFKMVLISLLVAAFAGTLVVLGFAIRLVWKYSLLGALFGCCKKLAKKVKKKKELQNNGITEDEENDFHDDAVELGDINNSTATPRPNRSVPRIPKLGRTFATMLLVCLVVCAEAQTCSQGITISSLSNECSYNRDVQTCTISLNTLLSIPAPGLSSCITVKAPDDTFLANITITYDQMIEQVPLQRLYYTSSWNGISFSTRSCPWGPMCGDGRGDCSTYNPLVDPGASGVIPPLYTSFQGLSRCDSQCGCAGCGCFSCASSCVYSRYALVPNSDFIAEVMRPISLHRVPQISIAVSNGEVTETESFEGKNENLQVMGNFTVRVEGSLTGSTTLFGAEKIVITNGDTRMGFASDVNAPVGGSLGDIQASHPGQLGPYGQYKVATGLATANPTSGSTNYHFVGSGFPSMSTMDVLPTMRGTSIWSRTGALLVGLNTEPGALLLSLNTPSGLTISRRVNVVCPSIISVDLVGCLACDQSATLVVRAKSTCSEGMALVEVTGSLTALTTSVVLSHEDVEIFVRVHSSTRSNSGTITLKAGPHTASIDYNGELQPENLVVIINGTFDNNNQTTTGGFPDVVGLFSGLPGFAQALISAIGAVIAVILIIVLGVLIFKGVMFVKKSRSLSKETTKYHKLYEDSDLESELSMTQEAGPVNTSVVPKGHQAQYPGKFRRTMTDLDISPPPVLESYNTVDLEGFDDPW